MPQPTPETLKRFRELSGQTAFERRLRSDSALKSGAIDRFHRIVAEKQAGRNFNPDAIDDPEAEEDYQALFTSDIEDIMPALSIRARDMMRKAMPNEGGGWGAGAMLSLGTAASAPQAAIFAGSRKLVEGTSSGMERSFAEKSKELGVDSVAGMNAEINAAVAGIKDPLARRKAVAKILDDQAKRVASATPGILQAGWEALKSTPGALWEGAKTAVGDVWTALTGSTEEKVQALTDRRENIQWALRNSGFGASKGGAGFAAGLTTVLQAPFAPLTQGLKGFKLLYDPRAWKESYQANKEALLRDREANDPNEALTLLTELFADPLNIFGAGAAFRGGAAKSLKNMRGATGAMRDFYRVSAAAEKGISKVMKPLETAVSYGPNLGNKAALLAAKGAVKGVKATGGIPLPGFMRNERMLTQTFGEWGRVNFSNATAAAKSLAFGSRNGAAMTGAASEIMQTLASEYAKIADKANKMANRPTDLAALNDTIEELSKGVFQFGDVPPQIKGTQAESMYLRTLAERRAYGSSPGGAAMFDADYPGVAALMDGIERGDVPADVALEAFGSLNRQMVMHGIGEHAARQAIPFDVLAPVTADAVLQARGMTEARLLLKESQDAILRATGALHITPAMANDVSLLSAHVAATVGPVYSQILNSFARLKDIHGAGIGHLSGWSGHNITDQFHRFLVNVMPSSTNWKGTGIIERKTGPAGVSIMSRLKQKIMPSGKTVTDYVIRDSKFHDAHRLAFAEILNRVDSAVIHDPALLARHGNDPVRAFNAKAIEEGIKLDPLAHMIENSLNDPKVSAVANRIMELRVKINQLASEAMVARSQATAAAPGAPYKGSKPRLRGQTNTGAFDMEIQAAIDELQKLEASRIHKDAEKAAYRAQLRQVRALERNAAGEGKLGAPRRVAATGGLEYAKPPVKGKIGEMTRKFARRLEKIARTNASPRKAIKELSRVESKAIKEIKKQANRQGLTISKEVLDSVRQKSRETKAFVKSEREGIRTAARASQDAIDQLKATINAAMDPADIQAIRVRLSEMRANRREMLRRMSKESRTKISQRLEDYGNTAAHELRAEIGAASWLSKHAPTRANLARLSNLSKANIASITRKVAAGSMTERKAVAASMQIIDRTVAIYNKAIREHAAKVDTARAIVELEEMRQAVRGQYDKLDDLLAARQELAKRQRIFDEHMNDLATFWDEAIDAISGKIERNRARKIVTAGRRIDALKEVITQRMEKASKMRYSTMSEDIDLLAGKTRSQQLAVSKQQGYLPNSSEIFTAPRQWRGSAAKKNAFLEENLGIPQAYAEDSMLVVMSEGKEASRIMTRHDVLTHLARELEEQGFTHRGSEPPPGGWSSYRPFWKFLEQAGIDRAGAAELYNMTSNLWVNGEGFKEAQAVFHRMGKAEEINSFVRMFLPFTTFMAKYTLAFPKFLRNNLATGLWFNHVHIGFTKGKSGAVYDAAVRYVLGDHVADKMFPPGSRGHRAIDITDPGLIGELNDRVLQARGRSASTISASGGAAAAMASSEYGGRLGPLRKRVVKGRERMVPIGTNIAEKTRNIPVVSQAARAVGATGRGLEKYSQLMLHAGSDIDNIMRIAAYLEFRQNRKMARAEALAMMRKYHFDLDLLSPAERAASSFGFYFPWARHAIPFAVASFIENPMAYYHAYQGARLAGLETMPDPTDSPYDTFTPTLKVNTYGDDGNLETKSVRANWMPEADALRLASTLMADRPLSERVGAVAGQHGNPWFDMIGGASFDPQTQRSRGHEINVRKMPFHMERLLPGVHADRTRPDVSATENPRTMHAIESFPVSGRAMSELYKMAEDPIAAAAAQVVPADVSTTDRNRAFYSGMAQLESAWRRAAGTYAARGYITRASMERDPSMWGLVGDGLPWRREDPDGYAKYRRYIYLKKQLEKLAYGKSDRRKKERARQIKEMVESIGR